MNVKDPTVIFVSLDSQFFIAQPKSVVMPIFFTLFSGYYIEKKYSLLQFVTPHQGQGINYVPDWSYKWITEDVSKKKKKEKAEPGRPSWESGKK